MSAIAILPRRVRAVRRPGGRTVALIAIVLVHALLLLALLFAANPPLLTKVTPPLVVRLITPAPAPAPRPIAVPRVVPHPNAVRIPKPIVDVPPRKETPPALFRTELFDAVDISKLPSSKGTVVADGTGGTGSGADSGTAYGPGAGPGGARLYAAQWYREPTDAELAPYLPRGLPDAATADIACRTIAHYGVEDCYELGETPPGTGLSRGLRQAGWQFKVRPPRIGGKDEIGAWVRIHYTISVTRKDG